MITFKNTDQFKYFMKKESKRLNLSIRNVYSTFISRLFLEKLSKLDKNKMILVKGSSAETTYLKRIVRGITDVDLASVSSIDVVIPVLKDIITDKDTNCFNFSLKRNPRVTTNGIYQFGFASQYDEINQTLNIDFQDNYNRLIEKKEVVMPKIFEGDTEFTINIPSFEEYLAEKLCIIIENSNPKKLNSRLKDFYDIYKLHGGKYDADKLTEYFKRMLVLRGKIKLRKANTDFLNKQFIENHQNIWDSVQKKYDFLDKEIDLSGAVYYTRAVLREELQKNGVKMTSDHNFPITKVKK